MQFPPRSRDVLGEVDYAKAVRTCRVACGLSQQELARRARLTPSYVCLIEGGKRSPTTEVLGRLSRALAIPLPLLTLLATPTVELNNLHGPHVDAMARALLEALTAAGAPAPRKPYPRSPTSR